MATPADDYSEIHEPGTPLCAPISPRDIVLGDKIGEGQFGDVHKGVLHPNVSLLYIIVLALYITIAHYGIFTLTMAKVNVMYCTGKIKDNLPLKVIPAFHELWKALYVSEVTCEAAHSWHNDERG